MVSQQSLTKLCVEVASVQVETNDLAWSGQPMTVGMVKNKFHIECTILENIRVIISEVMHDLGLTWNS